MTAMYYFDPWQPRSLIIVEAKLLL